MNKFFSILLISCLCISYTGFSTTITTIMNSENLESKSTDLKNTTLNCFFIPNNEFRTPEINDKLNFKLSDYDAIYNGPTSSKNKSLYLTFDEGYENGYANEILDVLKEKNVKTIFFVTSHYITFSPDTIKRMVNEGHIVANHTNHHYSMPSITYSREIFNKEFTDVEDKFKELTGQDMPEFFRPPMGQYSQKSLAMTKDLEHKTVFWSFAYGDYEPTNEPSQEYAKKHILGHLHD